MNPTNPSLIPCALNEEAMSTEKLAEGIRAFAADAVKLEQLMKAA
jgi:transaldolase